MLSYNPIFKVCTIEMTMGGRDQETVMLLPHKMNMRLSRNSSNQEKVELSLFNIIRWELTQRDSDCPEEGIRMIAVLKRKPWREVFTTYLPTILLIMTTYVTTFFKPQFFEAALGANLTTMLMMTTIFMASLSELTDTAYVKWIDVWLIFSQMVPFTQVILLTMKEAYRKEKQKKNTKISNLVINLVNPVEGEADSPQDLTPQVTDKKEPGSTRGTWKMPKNKLCYLKLIGETSPNLIKN